ncbi:MAG: 3-dehydroquinate synthase [Clostridia bacterium]|nr:3-dehydroquinate synthase [Clostridia bacterium]
MIITVKTSSGSYDIVLERGALNRISNLCNVKKRALIVTDDGVPAEYSALVSKQFPDSIIKTIPQGEKSKNFDTYKELLEVLCENDFSRNDCVVAVGGGVVGDMSGFVASTYMRGITFYNIPTTLLSQVDSSIGGKTAIDFGGYKNIVGAFYQPSKVIIDPEVLKTLSLRQFNNGLAESIKMGATSDASLFELIENQNAYENVDKVIEKSLLIKKAVVEEDEKEQGLRRVLNFGHTIGHAIETATGLGDLLHGECVALGMLALSSEQARARLVEVLKKYSLPYNISVTPETLTAPLKHDKKAEATGVNVVLVNEIGSFEFDFMEFSRLEKIIKEAY